MIWIPRSGRSNSALKAPNSRWRPDSFRLLALVLHQQGRTGEAQEAVERGMQAVDQLALDDDASASYRTWVGQALRDGVDQPPELRTAKSAQLLDEWLDEAYATGDWALCRRRLESAFQGNSSPEGACFGRAAACFHIDQDAGAAEDWLRVALRKPESRWRPDICRLLGVILQSRGDLSAAETALDAGLDAVPRLNFSDEEKARYTDWIELVLQPVRGRLLEKDRGGIKSVLRNGILTGERSDKRECREALLALKEIERNWTPDFISALLFAPVWRPMVAFVRAVYRGALRCMRVAVRLSPRVREVSIPCRDPRRYWLWRAEIHREHVCRLERRFLHGRNRVCNRDVPGCLRADGGDGLEPLHGLVRNCKRRRPRKAA